MKQQKLTKNKSKEIMPKINKKINVVNCWKISKT